MLLWLGIVVASLVVAVLATAVVLYLRYCLSPEKTWRSRVERRMADAENQLRTDRRELEVLRVRQEHEERALRHRALEAFLKSISVTELDAYPGIGSATVSKLRSAGFLDLAMLQDARICIPGLGAKRLADIHHAVDALVKQARSRFEAGACRSAQDLETQLQSLRVTYAQHESRLRARLAGTEAVIAELHPLLARARKVTFFRYLRRDLDYAVSEELLRGPLPDLGRTIQVAEHHTAAGYAGQNGMSGGDGRSASVAPPVQPDPRPGDRLSAAASLAAMPVSPPTGSTQVPEPPEPQELARLELIAEFGFAVARADGRVARKEKEIIERHIRTQVAGDRALLNRARAFCAHYEAAPIDLEKCLDHTVHRFSVEERRALFEFAREIADAAGPRNEREAELLERVASKLGISEQSQTLALPSPSQEATTPVPATLEDRLALLEIDPAAPVTADLVRRQFNLLSERYAADKFVAMGKEFVAMAEKKRAALRTAATALLEQWGEPLERESRATQAPELRHNPDLDAMFGA